MFQTYIQENQSGFSILYYNAWEHDIFHDALSSFVYQISQDDMFVDAEENKDLEKRKKTLHTVAKVALNAIVAVGAKRVFGGEGKEVIDKIRDAIQGKITATKVSSPYETRRKSLQALTAALSEYTSVYPLLVIIDELDRCAPDFAVQTFEIAKHLLNVPNTVFLFTLDMQQMKSAVQKVYGNSINTDGYICKIFDYIAVLPAPDKGIYCHARLQAYTHLNEQLLYGVQSYIYWLVGSEKSMSLRDIDTFLQSIQIMYSHFLYKYHCVTAQFLYIFILFLKYRYRDLYEKLLLAHELESHEVAFLETKARYRDLIKKLIDFREAEISDSPRIFYYKDTQAGFSFHGDEDSVHEAQIERMKSIGDGQIANSDLYSVNQLLYKPDFQIYEDIKLYTYGQHILRQLEMFNFTQPEDSDI